MYIVSEYATLIAMSFTFSLFLFALCLLVLTIKDELTNRVHVTRTLQNAGRFLWTRPAPVVVRDRISRR